MAHSPHSTGKITFQRIIGNHWTARHGVFDLQSAYQPLFAFRDKTMAPFAHEALLRVGRTGQPLPPPKYFEMIPDGQLVEAETGTRRLHIRNARCLPAASRRLFINFNPVAMQCAHQFESMADTMGDDLALAGLTPREVVCEITEQAECVPGQLARFAWALRARGYLVAIDDFGSDASDLKRVMEIGPDIVKFDGGLVRRMMRTQPGLETLGAMVKRFQRDRIATVLEGLEKPHHVAMAAWTGTDFMQGFALARPQLAGDIPRHPGTTPDHGFALSARAA